MSHTKMKWFNNSRLRVSKKTVIFAAKSVILTADIMTFPNVSQPDKNLQGSTFHLVAPSISMAFLETLIPNRCLIISPI